jgi:hypothetical protein
VHAPLVGRMQDWKRKYEKVQSRTQSVFGFADAYKTDSTESKELQAAIDAAAAAAKLSAGGPLCSADEEAAASAARAKAERALRIAYRSKIVYDVSSGERGDDCVKDGRLIRAEVVASVCIAADAARGG